MPVVQDSEFGEITVRTHQTASRISLRVAPDGRLRVSKPAYTPMLAVKAMLKTSRGQIRELLSEHQQQHSYVKDQPIGKSHNLVIHESTSPTNIATHHSTILVELSQNDDIRSQAVQSEIRTHILKALRKEAKSYLPRRLAYLAEQHDFDYTSVKLTHASSRWGSCSSAGTISLNISLMQLPFYLLDYVLIHELAHTKEMNHSAKFWEIVEEIDPKFKSHRSELKKYTPHI